MTTPKPHEYSDAETQEAWKTLAHSREFKDFFLRFHLETLVKALDIRAARSCAPEQLLEVRARRQELESLRSDTMAILNQTAQPKITNPYPPAL